MLGWAIGLAHTTYKLSLSVEFTGFCMALNQIPESQQGSSSLRCTPRTGSTVSLCELSQLHPMVRYNLHSCVLISLSLSFFTFSSSSSFSSFYSYPFLSPSSSLSFSSWHAACFLRIHFVHIFARSIMPLNKCVLNISQRFKGVCKSYRNCSIFILIIKTYFIASYHLNFFPLFLQNRHYLLYIYIFFFSKLRSLAPNRDSRI